MGYPQFSMKFSVKMPKETRKKWEIDGEYMDYYNRGVFYVATVRGPVFLDDWRRDEYKKNGIEGSPA